MVFAVVVLAVCCVILGAKLIAKGSEVQGYATQVQNLETSCTEKDVYAEGLRQKYKARDTRAGELESRFASVMDVDDEYRRVRQDIHDNMVELSRLRKLKDELEQNVSTLEGSVRGLEETLDLQSYGLYTPRYAFGDSGRYAARLKEIRAQQKAMVKDKTAAVCHTPFTVNGNAREGKKIMNNQIKIILRAFHSECDAAISKVTYRNLDTMEKRIQSSRTAINKLMGSGGYEITSSYLNLKLQELWLVFEYAEKKKEEADEQKRIKEQMKEEARAEKALERAAQDAAKEEAQYERALHKARQDFERASARAQANNEQAQAEMHAHIAALEAQLAEAQAKNQRAISQAQLTRSGHVYIISNEGSFGQGIYKIGMTRRLEPMDRVKELGDASVPFGFDVHAMIYSEDAPTLEKQLHHVFDARRVNRVNRRKEFFHVSLAEIEAAVREHCDHEIEFTRHAEAEEYRRSLDEAPTQHHASYEVPTQRVSAF